MHKNLLFGIRTRFFLAFLISCGALVLVMFVVFRLTFDRGLSRYVQLTEKQRMIELAEHVEQAYLEHNGWDFLRGNSTALAEIIRGIKISRYRNRGTSDTNESGPRPVERGEHRSEDRSGDKQHFEERFILLDENQKLLQGLAGPWPQPPTFITLKAEGEVIGQLGLIPSRIIVDGLVRLFAEGQHQTLKLLSLGMAAGVAILAILLAHLLLPNWLRGIMTSISRCNRPMNWDSWPATSIRWPKRLPAMNRSVIAGWLIFHMNSAPRCLCCRPKSRVCRTASAN